MSSIIGAVYPLPKEAIDFMFSNHNDVYVKYMSRGLTNKSKIKLKNGSTLYFYQSGGSKSVVGEACIESIKLLNMHEILKCYSGRLMISDDNFIKYAKGREDKIALVLILKNISRYKSEIYLKKSVTMAGLYLTVDDVKTVFCDYK